MEKRFYSPKEVAIVIGVTPATVRSWVRKGMMKSVRIGKQGTIRIPVSEIEKFLLNDSKGGDEDGSITN